MAETDILYMTLGELFCDYPPGTQCAIEGEPSSQNQTQWFYDTPQIQLYCPSNHCRRLMLHSNRDRFIIVNRGSVTDVFLDYTCNHCKKYQHKFAISAKYLQKHDARLITKVGQWPSFGPPLDDRLLSLVGGDRELLLQGRRSENQGLGVGAFAYYRRVVENQRSRIIEHTIDVAKKIGIDGNAIATLEAAKEETQFEKSVQMSKDAFPESLRVEGGHSPLTLLHTALSEGLHAETDEECLRLAATIRVVLGDLAERMSQILRDKSEVESAVKSLLEKSRARSAAKKES